MSGGERGGGGSRGRRRGRDNYIITVILSNNIELEQSPLIWQDKVSQHSSHKGCTARRGGQVIISLNHKKVSDYNIHNAIPIYTDTHNGIICCI